MANKAIAPYCKAKYIMVARTPVGKNIGAAQTIFCFQVCSTDLCWRSASRAESSPQLILTCTMLASRSAAATAEKLGPPLVNTPPQEPGTTQPTLRAAAAAATDMIRAENTFLTAP